MLDHSSSLCSSVRDHYKSTSAMSASQPVSAFRLFTQDSTGAAHLHRHSIINLVYMICLDLLSLLLLSYTLFRSVPFRSVLFHPVVVSGERVLGVFPSPFHVFARFFFWRSIGHSGRMRRSSSNGRADNGSLCAMRESLAEAGSPVRGSSAQVSACNGSQEL